MTSDRRGVSTSAPIRTRPQPKPTTRSSRTSTDVKELGDLIDQGEAALLVVGEGQLEEALDKAELKADKHVAKELDVLWKDVDKAVEEAAKDVS